MKKLPKNSILAPVLLMVLTMSMGMISILKERVGVGTKAPKNAEVIFD